MRWLIVLIFLALALSSFGTVKAINASNQNHKLIAHLRMTQEQEQQNRTDAVAANLRARRDDCEASNGTRKQLRAQAKQGLQGLLLVRTLFPQVPQDLIDEARRRYNQQVKAYAHRDCRAYALQAAPK